jgi:oxygen-independent coproporphyrinogen-3 oxidase
MVMDVERILKRYGLFDARVPRYTSYPPANRFEPGIGHKNQEAWLAGVRETEAISLYLHVPFCKRLCWFCACRTQGTRTLRPVADYVATLCREVKAVRARLPRGLTLSRLHLGGGTPTILDAPLMEKLLGAVLDAFAPGEDWEFSAEIDPTDASDEVLGVLIGRGLNRASIGVQDFAPEIQKAIGRLQSYEETAIVADKLRQGGVGSLNIDLLYGLPMQTQQTLHETVGKVLSLAPERLAFYGYAHVPWMSKRQVMIDEALLPDARARHRLAAGARERLEAEGYVSVGIDHFARPGDSLATSAAEGRLHRNFQGYTDDAAETLIGLGASAISKFREGYAQNAVATADYTARITASGLAAHRGVTLTPEDRMIAAMIEDIMCYGGIDVAALSAAFPDQSGEVLVRSRALLNRFPDLFSGTPASFRLPPAFMCMARIVAAAVEDGSVQSGAHSIAI